MSDDLISRKALMEKAKDYFISPDGALRLIESQPTAYDVDKVINMLKERAEHAERKAAEYDEKGDIPMMDIWDAEEKSYRNAIEIVKSGGVADD